MIKYAVIDTETIPSTTLPEGIKPEFDPDTVKTGAMGSEKAQEKIDKAKAEFDEALDKKMSLDPDLCEVVCLSTYAKGEQIYSYDHNWGKTANIITNAWKFISITYLDHIPLVSYNGIGFDLPVLLHAALRHNIPVSPQMYADLTKRYDNKYHYDLMQWFSNWDRTKWKSLSFYLKLFGIEHKPENGSKVYEWYQNQEYDKIRNHCEDDVQATAKLFERVQQWIVKGD